MRGLCLILANAIVMIGFSQLDQSQQKYRDTIQHETSFIENKGQVDGDSTLDILCYFQFQQLTGFVHEGGGITFQFQHNQTYKHHFLPTFLIAGCLLDKRLSRSLMGRY